MITWDRAKKPSLLRVCAKCSLECEFITRPPRTEIADTKPLKAISSCLRITHPLIAVIAFFRVPILSILSSTETTNGVCRIRSLTDHFQGIAITISDGNGKRTEKRVDPSKSFFQRHVAKIHVLCTYTNLALSCLAKFTHGLFFHRRRRRHGPIALANACAEISHLFPNGASTARRKWRTATTTSSNYYYTTCKRLHVISRNLGRTAALLDDLLCVHLRNPISIPG